MDDSTSESVKEVFGTDFQQYVSYKHHFPLLLLHFFHVTYLNLLLCFIQTRYCLRHKILIRKDKCGTFMVSNVNFLTECINILAEHRLNVNTKIEQVQICRTPPTVSNRKEKYYINF